MALSSFHPHAHLSELSSAHLLVLAVGDEIISDHVGLGRTVLSGLGDLQLGHLRTAATQTDSRNEIKGQPLTDPAPSSSSVGMISVAQRSIRHNKRDAIDGQCGAVAEQWRSARRCWPSARLCACLVSHLAGVVAHDDEHTLAAERSLQRGRLLQLLALFEGRRTRTNNVMAAWGQRSITWRVAACASCIRPSSTASMLMREHHGSWRTAGCGARWWLRCSDGGAHAHARGRWLCCAALRRPSPLVSPLLTHVLEVDGHASEQSGGLNGSALRSHGDWRSGGRNKQKVLMQTDGEEQKRRGEGRS